MFIRWSGGLTIADNCSISAYTKIITATHKSASSSFEFISRPTVIENNVWIGTAAIILDDSVLEQRCIIGAGCVFKGTAKENSIYVGNPATFMKPRDLHSDYSLCYHPFFR